MAIDLVIPTVGESITEVEIGAWLKQPGESVELDEAIVEIESDKATVEVYAPVAGVMGEILKQTGETAGIGDIVGTMEAGGTGTVAPAAAATPVAAPEPESSPVATETPKEPVAMPAAKRAMAEANVDPATITGSGKDGRILKEDVVAPAAPASPTPVPAATPSASTPADGARQEEVVRMTPIRRKIAQHLLDAQLNAALLTTFNEVDMSAVMAMRAEFKDAYLKKHGIKLGFMSFFVKTCIDALKAFPTVNAEIQNDNIVYKNYHDIGIAVSGKKGLVVPVLRNAERMSFAQVETNIADLGQRARDNKLKVDELTGGTFTITNGGIFGSMLSTPIINPPQSAILGMHNIVERAVVVDGEIVVRPMMYLALTYDHRIIDGREAVSFLVRVKQCIENPSRILLEI
ncbi:MAG: 2-oxoglutarate dehydrogenase complex dihydrolipoyllysine-residue succinyltransferase [Candidatus Hydrogenedentota bacterium]